MFVAELCNGSTPDSDSVCEGSNPSSAAKSNSPLPVGCFFICRLAPEPEQNKSNQRTKCRRRFEGSNPSSAAKSSSSVSMSCFFIMDCIFRTGNTRRQLPRRAFETIRDYPRICAMPTSMTADETYPTLCSLCKRPEQPQGTAALQTV